jgi:hypothetical protein
MQPQRTSSPTTKLRTRAAAFLRDNGDGPSGTVFTSGSIGSVGGLKSILLIIGVLSFLLFLVPESDVEAVFGVKMPKLTQPRPLIALGIIAALFALFARLHLHLVESRVLGLKTFALISPLDRKLLEIGETRSDKEEALELGDVAGAAWRLLGGISFLIHALIFLAVSAAVGFQLYHTLAPMVRTADMAACMATGWFPGTQLRSLSNPCTAWIISAVGATVALSALVKAAACLLVVVAPRRESRRVPLYFLLLVPAIPFFYLVEKLVGFFRVRALRGRQNKSAKQWGAATKTPKLAQDLIVLLESAAQELNIYAVEVVGVSRDILWYEVYRAGGWNLLRSSALYRVRNEFCWHRNRQPEGPFGVQLRPTQEEANDKLAQTIIEKASEVVSRPSQDKCMGPYLFRFIDRFIDSGKVKK